MLKISHNTFKVIMMSHLICMTKGTLLIEHTLSN